jgi:glycosyltransferase involved in cell wall biosynthesis
VVWRGDPVHALIIGGISRSLINFRGKMLQAMIAAGHTVTACAGEVEDDVVTSLSHWGVRFCGVQLDRRGTSLLGDRRYYQQLRQIIGQTAPDVVLCYTIKPVIYGSLAAANCGVPRIAAMITGVGAAQPGGTLKQQLVAALARRLYARALRHADVVFFQNRDDEAMFRSYRLLGKSRTVQIAGSGVDTNHYCFTPAASQPLTFLLIARLLVNKGIREYLAAAVQLKEKHGAAVRCLLAGPPETGGGGIALQELQASAEKGVIEYLGSLDDVRPAIRQCSVYVLPSYREGMPRTVLEAMSMGRAIITTDAPGCRETVVDGVNGYLIPLKDAGALAQAMSRFVDDPSLIPRMGASSRALAEARFDVDKVNQVILAELGLV